MEETKMRYGGAQADSDGEEEEEEEVEVYFCYWDSFTLLYPRR